MAEWTDCIMGKILKKVEIEEHPKINKTEKFGCETLYNVENVSL